VTAAVQIRHFTFGVTVAVTALVTESKEVMLTVTSVTPVGRILFYGTRGTNPEYDVANNACRRLFCLPASSKSHRAEGVVQVFGLWTPERRWGKLREITGRPE